MIRLESDIFDLALLYIGVHDSIHLLTRFSMNFVQKSLNSRTPLNYMSMYFRCIIVFTSQDRVLSFRYVNKMINDNSNVGYRTVISWVCIYLSIPSKVQLDSYFFFWLTLVLRPRTHHAGEILKRKFHSKNDSNVFRQHYAKGISKRNNHRSFWICVWGKIGQGNHTIIATPSFSKTSVFKVLSVHT